MGRRLNQLYPPYATPSSNSSLDYRRSDARIVENGFATTGGVSKSAKVVLTQPFAKRWIAAAGNDGRGARLLRGVLVLAAFLACEDFLGDEAGVLPDRGLDLGG